MASSFNDGPRAQKYPRNTAPEELKFKDVDPTPIPDRVIMLHNAHLVLKSELEKSQAPPEILSLVETMEEVTRGLKVDVLKVCNKG